MNIVINPIQFETDVKHMGPDDSMSSITVSNVTRQLAARDVTLAAKVNEVVSALSNATVPVPIVLPRTSVQAQGSVLLGNFRIPKGYIATVLNASVATEPVAKQAVLQVLHSAATFGQVGSGNGVTELVTTNTEVNFDGYFVGEGELIFKVTSTATRRLSVSSSVIIVLKPAA